MKRCNTDPEANPTADSGDRLNDFACSTAGWFWEMDENLRFVYFSPNVEDITGVPPQWHYGKTREELGIPQSVDPAQWRAHLDALQRGEPFRNFRFQRPGPDGLKWMQTSGTPVFNDAGEFCGYRGTATDVTAQVLAEQRSEVLAEAIEHISETFALWDSDDRLVTCNAHFRELNAAVVETTVPGTLFVDHVNAAMREGLYAKAHEGADDVEAWLADRIDRHRNGGPPMLIDRGNGHWIQVADHHLPNGSIATISTDVSEGQRLRKKLEWLASNDTLTKVLNRRGFVEHAKTEFSRCVRYDRPLSFLMLDIDHFKRLNDRWGHLTGDEALATVADACRSSLRDCDEIGRLGGEEFGILLPETRTDAALLVAERLRSTVQSRTSCALTNYGPVTISIGIACRSADHVALDDLMNAADKALYSAKDGGRNRTELAA